MCLYCRRYNYLKRTGERWANRYTMSTDRQYLAEGAQSFFDVDSDVDPPNGIHNFVNTREELKAYDPIMFGYCQEIFPCGNRIVDRCDDAKRKLLLLHLFLIRVYLPTCLPSFLHTYLPTYLPAYLLSYIPTYLPTYLPTYIHTYIDDCYFLSDE